MSILKDHNEDVKRRFSVKRIGLFGSASNGKFTDASDVDVLVEFEDPTYDNFIGLVLYLESVFKRNVDLVTKDGVSPYMYPQISQEVLWCE